MMLSGAAIILAEIFRGDQAVFLLGVVGSVLLLLAMWRARRAYGPAVADAVRAGRPDVFTSEEEPFGGFRTDAAAVATLLESSTDSDADVRRLAIVIAADMGSSDVLPAILAGASDDDPEVRAAALHSLARHPDPAGSAPAADALNHPDPAVRASAVDALVACSHETQSVEAALRQRLSDQDSQVGARAAAGLVRLQSDPNSRDRLVAMARSSEPAARAAAVVAMGDLGERVDLVEEAVTDTDPDVRKSALRALASFTRNGQHGALVSALGDPDGRVRDEAVAALTTLGPGAVELLEDALSDPRLEINALHALRNIGGAHFERVRPYAHDQVVAATRYGGLVQRLGVGADERILLLAHALRARMVRHATNALWANAALSNNNRLGPAIESLSSPNSTQRATALEAIEALGEPEIVGPLLAIWEREPDHKGDLEAVVEALLADDDPWLRACAALACELFASGSFADRLRELSTKDPDPDVRAAAKLTLGGVKMKTLDTLPPLKRVLFLRKVSLFAELSPADLKSVANAAVENLYPNGEVIAAQGEPGGEMHVVVSGEIEVDMGFEDDRLELARRGPGEVVGEMSLITENPRMASLVAVGEVRTLSIDRSRFERILIERPDVSLAVMRELCARLTQSLDRAVARR